MKENRKYNGRTGQSRTKNKKRRNDKASSVKCDNRDRELAREESPTNDPSWYAQTPELMRLAANIPFSQAAGTAFDLGQYNDATDPSVQLVDTELTIPGILTMSLIPMPSQADAANAPLNIAATSLFSFVRHANSGTPMYNSPDLMLYCIAMGQVYSYINFLQRIYGSMNLYANMNRYLPRAIVQAQGVNYDSILQNLPNFKYGIDTLIHKAASLACPAAMTYFQRVSFLFSGIYAEGESIKDQLYMYVPQGFMQYNETADEQGGSLQYLPFMAANGVPTTPYTYQALIEYGNKLLDPIISSEDMNIMSGDILKAFGSNGILTLQTLPDVYIVQPVTDLTVLEQFQNANWISQLPTTMTITQSQKGLAGNLRSKAIFPFEPFVAGVLNGDKPLTTILTVPEAGDVMERTRLMLTGSATATSIEVNMATEIPVFLNCWYTDPATKSIFSLTVGETLHVGSATPNATLISALNVHCMMENFKFHPALYYYTSEGENSKLMNIALDFDNYAVVGYNDLRRINEAALLSMFNVNAVATAYK